MKQRQRLATLVILQGFIRWAIQEGVIREDHDQLLNRYLTHLKKRHLEEA